MGLLEKFPPNHEPMSIAPALRCSNNCMAPSHSEVEDVVTFMYRTSCSST